MFESIRERGSVAEEEAATCRATAGERVARRSAPSRIVSFPGVQDRHAGGREVFDVAGRDLQAVYQRRGGQEGIDGGHWTAEFTDQSPPTHGDLKVDRKDAAGEPVWNLANPGRVVLRKLG